MNDFSIFILFLIELSCDACANISFSVIIQSIPLSFEFIKIKNLIYRGRIYFLMQIMKLISNLIYIRWACGLLPVSYLSFRSDQATNAESLYIIVDADNAIGFSIEWMIQERIKPFIVFHASNFLDVLSSSLDNELSTNPSCCLESWTQYIFFPRTIIIFTCEFLKVGDSVENVFFPWENILAYSPEDLFSVSTFYFYGERRY